MATRSTPAAASNAPNYTGPFITVAILFGIFGFLTSLNNVLVKKLEDVFTLSHGGAMLATAAWFFAYLVFSVPSAKLIKMVGYKRTMVISLLVMSCGALLFVPAANMVSFHMTLFAIFVLASGVCALQTSANPYVSILGPEKSAPARLTLAQAFNSIGSLAAPWVAGIFILSSSSVPSDPTVTAHMLRGPYIAIAGALLILGLVGIALLLTAMFTHGHLAIACLVLTGVANSVMYPNIFALGIAELGPLTSKGSGVITIGNVGGAIIPPLFGLLADKVGIQYAFVIPIIGYLYVAYYGLSGYKPTRAVKP